MDRVRRALSILRAVAGERFGRTEGQGLVEYSLILLFIAVGLVGALVGFGSSLSSEYAAIVSAFPSV
jgi:Flp pilus assembly pilin Flp